MKLHNPSAETSKALLACFIPVVMGVSIANFYDFDRSWRTVRRQELRTSRPANRIPSRNKQTLVLK